jgi:hypothetical protein
MPSDDGPSARYSDGSGTRVQPLAEPGRLVPIAHTTRTEVQVVGRVGGPITAPAVRPIITGVLPWIASDALRIAERRSAFCA